MKGVLPAMGFLRPRSRRTPTVIKGDSGSCRLDSVWPPMERGRQPTELRGSPAGRGQHLEPAVERRRAPAGDALSQRRPLPFRSVARRQAVGFLPGTQARNVLLIQDAKFSR